MPGPSELLDGFRRISNDAFALAVLWHAWIAAGALAIGRGKVTEQRAGEMLSVLPASVSGVAFAYGNPFNGVAFAALAVALVAFSRKMSAGRVQAGPLWVAGLLLMAFGWAYPEFLDRPALAYLAGAPLGLLPCPTLAMLIGATLFLGGLGSRGWSLTLAAAGLFYGLFGAARLGVRLDLVLALGAVVLGVSAGLPLKPAVPRRRPAR